MKYRIKINNKMYLSELCQKNTSIQGNFSNNQEESITVLDSDLAELVSLLIQGDRVESMQIEKVVEKQMPKLTETERYILKEVFNHFYWVARDENRGLFWSLSKPRKELDNGHWVPTVWSEGGCDYIRIFNNLFQFVKWEDEEPWNIEELLLANEEANENE